MMTEALKKRGEKAAQQQEPKAEGERGVSAPPASGGDAFTRQRLGWLESVAAEATLPVTAYRLATIVALRYLNRTRGFAWPSLATLSTDLGVGKKAILRAVEALESHGLLSVVRSRGRGHANEYRIETPAEKGIRADTFSDDEKGVRADTISCGKGIRSISEKVSARTPHPFEEPSEGAGAHSARPAPHPSEVLVEETQERVRAPERAPPSLSLPSRETDPRVGQPSPLRGRPVTLDDLDQLHHEELVAATEPRAVAAAELADVLGDRLLDPREFVADLIDAFIGGDGDAQAHVSGIVADWLIDATRPEAARLWAGLHAIAREVFAAADQDKAEGADSDFIAAVGLAGKAEQAARRAAAAEAMAEDTTVTETAVRD
jgi:biotin operon repressor